MPRFRKLPVEIEAIQWDGDNWKDVSELDNSITQNGTQLRIVTLEGTMLANINDWVIKGVNGEVYPCKPDIFDKTYEPVE